MSVDSSLAFVFPTGRAIILGVDHATSAAPRTFVKTDSHGRASSQRNSKDALPRSNRRAGLRRVTWTVRAPARRHLGPCAEGSTVIMEECAPPLPSPPGTSGASRSLSLANVSDGARG